MYDLSAGEITRIEVLVPTATTVVSYRMMAGPDGWQVQDPHGTIIEQEATAERALSYAACLSAGAASAC